MEVDTRKKIIDTQEAERIINSGAIVVSGYFDPLTAAHAERLAAIKQNREYLLVLINTPTDVILPAAARAELVAGLRMGDYLAIIEGGLTPQPRAWGGERD